jgi:glycosyltransferase involved in cell wall biosynthesis
MKNVVIFEPKAGGHQMHHASWIVKGAVEAGNLNVHLVTTARALEHPSASSITNIDHPRFKIGFIDPNSNSFSYLRHLHPVLQEQFLQTQALSHFLRNEYARKQLATLFIPFFDAYALWPIVVRPQWFQDVDLSGIIYLGKHHFPQMRINAELKFHSRVEQLAYRNILRGSKSIQLFTVDPYLARFWDTDRLKFLPDPQDFAPDRSRERLREELGIPSDQMLIFVFGVIDRRKAIGTLLDALALDECAGVSVMIGGQQSPDVQELLKSTSGLELRRKGRLFEIPRFLNGQEVDNLFNAADIIWACYINSDSSSGVLVKAGRAARPAIVSQTGLAAKLVMDYEAGWLADPTSAQSVAKAVLDARYNLAKRNHYAKNLSDLFREHTQANFVNPIVEYLTRT